MKRVAIWIRVSTEDQARGESPENHRLRAQAYADLKGWKVVEVYDLSGVSGKSVTEHDEAKRMLADIKSGSVEALIFSKLARLARNTRELLDFADYFQEHGADLISLSESIDTSTPAGRLFYTMIAAMAEWERNEIAERVAASVPIRAKQGKNVGGQATFGYQWVDNQLIPHPEEAPVRVLVYELFLEHKRKKTVARLLNERGYRTRKGGKFSDTTITRFLEDPTPKGIHRANYTRSKGVGKAAELKPQKDWIYTEVEPIVDVELWDACYAILQEQRKSRKPVARKTVYLFSGIAKCASCGKNMYRYAEAAKYKCKPCRNGIGLDDLEEVFAETLRSFFFSPEEIAEYLEASSDSIQEKQKLVSVLETEFNIVSKEMDKTYDLYIADKITADGFQERYSPLENRRNQLEKELPRMQGELDALKISLGSKDQIIAEAQSLYNKWTDLSFQQKRDIVEAIVQSIIIGNGDVEINLHYVPNPHEMRNTCVSPSSSSATQEIKSKKATHEHGFMAAISWNLAG